MEWIMASVQNLFFCAQDGYRGGAKNRFLQTAEPFTAIRSRPRSAPVRVHGALESRLGPCFARIFRPQSVRHGRADHRLAARARPRCPRCRPIAWENTGAPPYFYGAPVFFPDISSTLVRGHPTPRKPPALAPCPPLLGPLLLRNHEQCRRRRRSRSRAQCGGRASNCHRELKQSREFSFSEAIASQRVARSRCPEEVHEGSAPDASQRQPRVPGSQKIPRKWARHGSAQRTRCIAAAGCSLSRTAVLLFPWQDGDTACAHPPRPQKPASSPAARPHSHVYVGGDCARAAVPARGHRPGHRQDRRARRVHARGAQGVHLLPRAVLVQRAEG